MKRKRFEVAWSIRTKQRPYGRVLDRGNEKILAKDESEAIQLIKDKYSDENSSYEVFVMVLKQ